MQFSARDDLRVATTDASMPRVPGVEEVRAQGRCTRIGKVYSARDADAQIRERVSARDKTWDFNALLNQP